MALPRRVTSLALTSLLALSMALSACGDDGEDDADTTTTEAERSSNDDSGDASDDEAREIGEKALEDNGLDLDDDITICVGRYLIDEVGTDEATRVAELEDDFADMSDEDRELVTATLDECMPGDVMAASMVAEFAGELPDFDSTELEECLAEQFEGKVGTIVVELDQADDDEAAMQQLFGDCPTDGLVVAAITSSLSGSMSPEGAKCVAEQVAQSTTFQEFMAAESDPAVEEVLTQRMTEAVASCPA